MAKCWYFGWLQVNIIDRVCARTFVRICERVFYRTQIAEHCKHTRIYRVHFLISEKNCGFTCMGRQKKTFFNRRFEITVIFWEIIHLMSQYHKTDEKKWMNWFKVHRKWGSIGYQWSRIWVNTHTSKLWIENRLLIDNFTSIYSMNHSSTELIWTRRGYVNTEQFTI